MALQTAVEKIFESPEIYVRTSPKPRVADLH